MTAMIFCISMFAAISLVAQTTPMVFQSATEQTPLVELYTSEGCSSCPPAETWMSHLKDSPGLWNDFVPVAFHVDYWDYLGWRDPWSSKQFSDRQRAYAAAWRGDSIYTPGVVLNGREWRDWAGGKSELKRSPVDAGVLSMKSSDTNHWQIMFKPAKAVKGDAEVHVALLASGLTSDVRAGENRGRTLTHDFAVIDLVDGSLTRSGDELRGEVILPRALSAKGRLAIAAWITRDGNVQPMQAVGGWLH